MRQMKKKIIIAIIVTLLLTAAVASAVWFMVVKDQGETIDQLRAQVADIRCLAFATDLPADAVITQSDITEVDIKRSSMASGSYQVLSSSSTDVLHYLVSGDSLASGDNLTVTKESLIGRVVKANVSKNTVILDSLLYPVGEEPTIDERLQEFNFLRIPSDVVENDYVDVRIRFPNGEDYSVLVGKKVEKIAGENTIFIKMDEEEIMAMGSAIIEAYMQDGVDLYANKYVDPATQLFDESIQDYVAKYEYAVDKLTKEIESLRLRRAIVDVILADTEHASMDETTGEITYNYGSTITPDQLGNPVVQGGTTLVLSTENQDVDGKLVYAVTEEMMDQIPEEIKTQAQTKVGKVTLADLAHDTLARYAGIKEDYIDEIQIAKEEGTTAVLNYYRVMRVLEPTEIERTYPVREEVLAVIRANPNLLDEIKNNFDTVALTNTRIDEYHKLEAQLAETTDPYEREEIEQAMEELVDKRVENVEKAIQDEVTAQREERVSYLESLINE